MSPNAETVQPKPVPEDKSKSHAKAQAKVDLKPGAKSNSKDDLKSLPMPELQTKAGVYSRWSQPGRSQEAADAIRPERNRGKEDQRIPEVPELFLGSDPVDD